ncbi:helix-turn-helix domain-containing protein [Streptomyces sp. NBC_00201]|uniref:helix-turn-helix domain-containing protein n=1 Tax=Streptomyces sp. NBC_00201 TaxID=2975679 RepID=UPI00225C0637|nr:helix-turn-helix domain-containing protein [Streptomyces sp. NBC_00201]MCX5248092.1 helix-turn-helix domain-containing protein [Streptomyces sp. NBC_00201]
MATPRRDTRGIVGAADFLARVDFRRPEPAEPLRRHVEHYWLIDWDLQEPYVSQVVPHPAVHIVFQRFEGQEPVVEVAGIQQGVFTQKLEGRGRVCGIKFRPGAFRPFAPGRAVSEWTGRRVFSPEIFPQTDLAATVAAALAPDDERARIAALDAFLLALDPRPDPQADLATALVDRIRTDRTIRRVADFARTEGMSVRLLQRLFAGYVGVGPKWVILRYRIHEALEHAETDREVDWAALAADLGYADQAHLVRDFTATVGVPPTAYAANPTASTPAPASAPGT